MTVSGCSLIDVLIPKAESHVRYSFSTTGRGRWPVLSCNPPILSCRLSLLLLSSAWFGGTHGHQEVSRNFCARGRGNIGAARKARPATDCSGAGRQGA